MRSRAAVSIAMEFVGLFAMSAPFGIAQNCVPYGAPTRIVGTLVVKDEAGYNQFIALRLAEPICTVSDQHARPNTLPEADFDHVREMQAGVYGSDADSNALRSRLSRLVGQRVAIRGVLFAAHTGYHRTNVQFSVSAVDPLDTAGQAALRAPIRPFQAKDVTGYDVTVNAGQRLVIAVRDPQSGSALVPTDEYFSHWMTGGEVPYLNCRDGYARRFVSSSAKDGFCSDDDLCGISAFPSEPITLKFRCVREPVTPAVPLKR